MRKLFLYFLWAVLLLLEVVLVLALLLPSMGDSIEMARAVQAIHENPSHAAEAQLKKAKNHLFRQQLLMEAIIFVPVVVNALAIWKVHKAINAKSEPLETASRSS